VRNISRIRWRGGDLQKRTTREKRFLNIGVLVVLIINPTTIERRDEVRFNLTEFFWGGKWEIVKAQDDLSSWKEGRILCIKQ
jgi:hypothetical protein